MLGVFYYEHHYLRKAEGCFTLSHSLRNATDTNEQFIPDNLFNLAAIKLKQGNRRVAQQ